MSTPNYRRILFIIIPSLLLYFALITSLLHYERAESGASITHLHEAIWYSIITIITMGYGDLAPVSAGGKIIGIVFALLSISIYILIIAYFFAIVFRRRKRIIG
ncbi:ion channel [Bacteroidota bacterium]